MFDEDYYLCSASNVTGAWHIEWKVGPLPQEVYKLDIDHIYLNFLKEKLM